jgi:dUTPase
MKYSSTKIVSFIALIGVVLLSGCEVMEPLIGWGAMEITLEGKATAQAAIESFQKAVRADGGFVNTTSSDSATASFKKDLVNLDMTVEPADKETVRIVIRSSSSVESRIEVKNNLGEIPLKVAGDMKNFVIVSQRRL